MFQALNHRDKWRKFKDICLDVIMRYFPKRKVYQGNRSRVPRDRKILLRRRRKIQKFLGKKNSADRIGRLKRELPSIEVRLQALYESSRQVEEEKAYYESLYGQLLDCEKLLEEEREKYNITVETYMKLR